MGKRVIKKYEKIERYTYIYILYIRPKSDVLRGSTWWQRFLGQLKKADGISNFFIFFDHTFTHDDAGGPQLYNLGLLIITTSLGGNILGPIQV